MKLIIVLFFMTLKLRYSFTFVTKPHFFCFLSSLFLYFHCLVLSHDLNGIRPNGRNEKISQQFFWGEIMMIMVFLSFTVYSVGAELVQK